MIIVGDFSYEDILNDGHNMIESSAIVIGRLDLTVARKKSFV